MIRVTVELVPHGVEENKKVLATGKIWNDGSGSPWLGSYGYELKGANDRVIKAGYLGEYKRNDYHIWWLLAAVLKTAYPDVDKAFRDGKIRSRVET